MVLSLLGIAISQDEAEGLVRANRLLMWLNGIITPRTESQKGTGCPMQQPADSGMISTIARRIVHWVIRPARFLLALVIAGQW